MENKDIIFASLLGSKVLKTARNLSLVQNAIRDRVLPTFPADVKINQSGINGLQVTPFEGLNRADAPLSSEQQYFPMSFSFSENGENFLLPYEPMIDIKGKNNIIRRNVAKWRADISNLDTIGSIKERWNQDDYEITITGVLIGSIMTGKVDDCYPKKDFEKLRDLLTYHKELYVYCEPLQLLNINKIVIEDFSFPFTKGENVQAYEIKAFSDGSYKLLYEA